MTTIGYLYYFKYNNYYNRTFKIQNYVADYGTPIGHTANPVNFNPNDQVLTTQVINDENITGADYLLVVSSSDSTILSRWFILECKRNLYNQWIVTLRRDVLADNWSAVQNEPMLIERATVPDTSPFIFNPESVAVNQIKQSETLLKDETGCGWICGYVSPYSDSATETAVTKTFDTTVIPDYKTYEFSDFRSTYMNNLNFNTYYKGTPIVSSYKIKYTYYNTSVSEQRYGTLEINIDSTGSITSIGLPDRTDTTADCVNLGSMSFTQLQTLVSNIRNNFNFQLLINYWRSYVTDINDYSYSNYQTIQRLNNNYLYLINSDADYKLITTIQDATSGYDINSDIVSPYIKTYLMQLLGLSASAAADGVIRQYISYKQIKIGYQSVTTGTYSFTLSKDEDRYSLKDAPYYMFCIPYGNNITVSISGVSYNIDQRSSMYIAQGLAKCFSGRIMDVQLLPYCPMSGFTITTSSDITNFNFGILNTKRYTMVKNAADTNIYPVFWATASSGTKQITNITGSISNYKMDSMTKKCRLCSPNMSGIYEFDFVKNKGISGFNIDYTYLPYNPYIHVTFIHNDGSLYGYDANTTGNDWNDATGLICGGQFSISYNSDAWEQYELNNKNYQNSFDRQIQNMDTMHKYDMLESGLTAVTGTLTGAASGALTGSITGVGGIAGAAVGGAASLAGGIADQIIADNKYKESKSYATDQFNMQLDNVKSLPNTLAKVTAYTENNKVFPFVEVYDCTAEEKTAVANKIRYNGMTLGVVGTINDYKNNSWSYSGISDKGFIKGKLLQTTIADDYHTAASIAEELEKGVYFK